MKVVFLPNGCYLQDLQTDKVVGKRRANGNLYCYKCNNQSDNFVIDTVDCKGKTIASNCLNVTTLENRNNGIKGNVLWHNRLGHPSDDVIKHFDNKVKQQLCEPYDVYVKAKQSRSSFPLRSRFIQS